MAPPAHGLDWPAPYAVLLVLGLGVEWWFARRRARLYSLDTSHIDLLVPLTFVAAMFAAPLLGVVMPQERQIAGDAFLVEERLRLPAVVIAGLVIVFAYGGVARLSSLRLADVIAPAVILFIAILRIGCLLAGCCFGDVVGHADAVAGIADTQLRLQVQTLPALSPDGLPWAVRVPAESFAYRQHLALGLIEPGAPASLPVHPVQLYEAAAALLLLMALLWLERAPRRPGALTVAAISGYAVIACGLQLLRADSPLLLGPLNGNQLVFLTWLAAVLLAAIFKRARTGRQQEDM